VEAGARCPSVENRDCGSFAKWWHGSVGTKPGDYVIAYTLP
jgi:glucose dehydrogenase